MPADVIPMDDPRSLEVAAAALRAGAPIVVPTDTVYGLAVLATAEGGTDEVYRLKARPAEVPLAVLVADRDQAGKVADVPGADSVLGRALAHLWPGPLTVVVARKACLAVGTADGTVGVRCPDHPWVRALCALVGPIATTSANRHGQPTPHTVVEAVASLAGEVAVAIDGGVCDQPASTVLDATGEPLRVLRPGAVGLADVAAAGALPAGPLLTAP